MPAAQASVYRAFAATGPPTVSPRTGIFQLRTGNARILYEVDDEASVVYIINFGRVS